MKLEAYKKRGSEKMKKLNGTSMDLVQENVKKLKEIFPEIFIEGRIDFNLLRQIIVGGGTRFRGI